MRPLEFSNEPKQILVILPTWVGILVMATPFIRQVQQHFAQAQLSFVMHRHLLPLLENSPWQGETYFWPKKNHSSKADGKRLVAQLRAQQFDLAITLPNSFSSAWLAWRRCAKRRVGFARDGRSWLLTDPIPVPNKASARTRRNSITKSRFEPMPLVLYYDHLAQALGCATTGDALALFTNNAEDESVAARLLAGGAAAASPLVTLCPGANFGASKCWAPERFAGVADRLVQEYGATIAISPGPGEEPLAEAISHAMDQPNLLLTAPCLTLGELKSLIKRSLLLLGNDTGPRHFARAFDVHRVTVFGPTEEQWTATSHGRESIVRVQVPCGPCHLKVCPRQRQDCMEDVTEAMVMAACRTEIAAARV